MNRKLYIQKNKDGANWDEGTGVSSQGFHFPRSVLGVLVKRHPAGICFRTNISTVTFLNGELVFVYIRLEVRIPVTYPYLSHSTVVLKHITEWHFSWGPHYM